MKGFTLLEVIVALIIAGMAALALFQAVGTGLHGTRNAVLYDQAIVRAKSRLAASTHGTALTAGDWRGDDGGGFRYRLRVAPVASTTKRPVGLIGPRAASSIAITLYQITVWIAWTDGGSQHDVQLDTQQVGG